MTLTEFFKDNPKGALALSGGSDSSLLAWAAGKYGEDWRAYFVHSEFQPESEIAEAEKVAQFSGIPLTILQAEALEDPKIAANPKNRCYFCKHKLFSLMQNRALEDGFSLLIDGTNASDDEGDRPGIQALRELKVRSPLRECGITKQEVRTMSKTAGLFTWDKPSYACLATRIPTGIPITSQLLTKIEESEKILFQLGFSDFRIRLRGELGLIQLPANQLSRAMDQREALLSKLSPYFPTIALDLNPRG